jgi:hypothetical protein
VLMEEAANACMAFFQALKAYIEDAFPANLIKMKLAAAGQSYYFKAQAYNRDALNNLNLTAVQFIKNNED